MRLEDLVSKLDVAVLEGREGRSKSWRVGREDSDSLPLPPPTATSLGEPSYLLRPARDPPYPPF